ncbi:MAG: type II toxin-antitoxin system RelE/ParE family toxin [Deltaproteobacteria bacterium]|nr:type II toxin-antitoxin system RelE/ParE family toxin [Deltaproteobacteria bacterium]
MPIRSFGDTATENFFHAGRTKKGAGWASLKAIVKRKLDMVNYAAKLEDLKSPPGNRLEALVGDLKGFHSIRINDQWRVVFRWSDSGPLDVRVCDYH